MGRIVGVDYGRKRVGLAVADPLRMFAQPFGAYNPREAVDVLRKLHRDEGLETIVVGWPLMLDGSEGDATRVVQEFVNRLRNALRDVVVVKLDERYTSEIAHDLVREARGGRRVEKRSGDVDAAAAAIILQDFLDGHRHSGPA